MDPSPCSSAQTNTTTTSASTLQDEANEMSLHRVPGADELYIGGALTLRRKSALKRAKITHILSLLRMTPDEAAFEQYEHLTIEVWDVEDENMLEHFPRVTRFIHDALDGGGAVLVHCVAGKSRSSTCVIAFLMQKYHLSPADALARLQDSRPMCEPNAGFMRQLELYGRMQCPSAVDDHPVYQRWLYEREVERSVLHHKAPETVLFADDLESDAQAQGGSIELRCRKCRRRLATNRHRAEHTPPGPEEGLDVPVQPCAHFFLEPLSWMRSELEQGKLSGRLACPTCTTNIGKYAWQGMRCSCGQWTVPGITVAKSKVDEVPLRRGRATEDQMGIRRPPTTPPESPSHAGTT